MDLGVALVSWRQMRISFAPRNNAAINLQCCETEIIAEDLLITRIKGRTTKVTRRAPSKNPSITPQGCKCTLRADDLDVSIACPPIAAAIGRRSPHPEAAIGPMCCKCIPRAADVYVSFVAGSTRGNLIKVTRPNWPDSYAAIPLECCKRGCGAEDFDVPSIRRSAAVSSTCTFVAPGRNFPISPNGCKSFQCARDLCIPRIRRATEASALVCKPVGFVPTPS